MKTEPLQEALVIHGPNYELQSFLIEEDDENKIDFSSDNFKIKSYLTYDEVKELNGKHSIFGLIELFEQSGEVPQWYSRNTCRYSYSVLRIHKF
jgi:hypothetical protein